MYREERREKIGTSLPACRSRNPSIILQAPFWIFHVTGNALSRIHFGSALMLKEIVYIYISLACSEFTGTDIQ